MALSSNSSEGQFTGLDVGDGPKHAALEWRHGVAARQRLRKVYRVNGRVSTSSVDAVRAAAVQGLGIAMLAYWDVYQQLRDGTLVEVELADAGMEQLAVWAVMPTRRYLPARVRVFLEMLEAELALLNEK